MGMTGGTSICQKHEWIADMASDIIGLVHKAKEDGESMEKALKEKNTEIKELSDQVDQLSAENEELKDEIKRYSLEQAT